MLVLYSLLCIFYLSAANILSPAPADETNPSKAEAEWRTKAITRLWEEREKFGHTPLVAVPVKGLPNLRLYIKNETATPTRSLKHRFVWGIAMWAVVDGHVTSTTTAFDSTSGNTGAGEAYMFSAIGNPFVAVVSHELEEAKVQNIQKHGGTVKKVDSLLRASEAAKAAEEANGFLINQFGNAEKAVEFFESGDYAYESTNIFHEVMGQLKNDSSAKKKSVDYFVHPAGTGGTISSVGRYVDRYNLPTKVVLADSEFSVFFDYVIHNTWTNESGKALWKKPGVAGTGYGNDPEPVIFGKTTSLIRSVIDEAVKIPDIATAAGLREFNDRGLDGGPSSALNLLVCLHLAIRESKTEDLTVVTLLSDPAEFYLNNYFNDTWIEQMFADRGGLTAINCWRKEIASTMDKGTDFLAGGLENCKPEK